MSDQQQKSDEKDQQDGGEPQKHPPTILGWIIRFVSVALLLLLSGIVIWKMSAEKKDVAFTAEVVADEVRQEGQSWLVPVDVTNDGSYTAERVRMDLTVGDTTETVEIEMIGAKETVRYVLSTDAPADSVTHEIVSYEAP